MCDDILSELKQFMFYDRPPQLNVPVEHRENPKEKVVQQERQEKEQQLKELKPSRPRKPQLQLEQKDTANQIFSPRQKDTANQIFSPRQKDSLFWCFYKIIHDDFPDNINIAMEKTLKIKYVEEMRKHKELIKKYKFASMTHIENQLANEEVIDITAFFVLSLIHKLNVVYVKNQTYFELIVNPESESPIYVIHFLEQSKY